jgi:hypothetical protein
MRIPSPRGSRGAGPPFGGAVLSTDLKEWVLPYDTVRRSSDPDRDLLDFCQDTYDAAANLAGWDRQALEWSERLPGQLDARNAVR